MLDLYENSEELLVLSGGQNDFFGNLFKLNKISELEKIILKLNDILKDRFYLEIQRHGDKDEKNFENYLIEVCT